MQTDYFEYGHFIYTSVFSPPLTVFDSTRFGASNHSSLPKNEFWSQPSMLARYLYSTIQFNWMPSSSFHVSLASLAEGVGLLALFRVSPYIFPMWPLFSFHFPRRMFPPRPNSPIHSRTSFVPLYSMIDLPSLPAL